MVLSLLEAATAGRHPTLVDCSDCRSRLGLATLRRPLMYVLHRLLRVCVCRLAYIRVLRAYLPAPRAVAILL
jgi:hypothetical protein